MRAALMNASSSSSSIASAVITEFTIPAMASGIATVSQNIPEDGADNSFNADSFYQQDGEMVRVGGLAHASESGPGAGIRMPGVNLPTLIGEPAILPSAVNTATLVPLDLSRISQEFVTFPRPPHLFAASGIRQSVARYCKQPSRRMIGPEPHAPPQADERRFHSLPRVRPSPGFRAAAPRCA